ncbi:hypothetical protein GK047_28125 [Paenibacillus sp. SYP-B3998]|uniref:Uncharacterized protein n=2 Tax=Paenibacillus sp. SYP-B3998 TaxID=2678564 RepID=A0A6G4A7J4_9BACL|nr:hypothetical protein [Paenibacillus sp. SYP-B3998]
MDKQAALQDFFDSYVSGRWQNDILLIDETYKQQKEQIDSSFILAFDNACRLASELQEQGLKGHTQYIYISLLRTSFMENTACYRIDVYDNNWFLDQEECFSLWEADFIFHPLFDRRAALETQKTDYARKVTSMDIEQMLLEEAELYHMLALAFMRSRVGELIQSHAYQEMSKHPNLCIFSGEYKDRSEILYGESGADA